VLQEVFVSKLMSVFDVELADFGAAQIAHVGARAEITSNIFY
jgi:hypothetical protein